MPASAKSTVATLKPRYAVLQLQFNKDNWLVSKLIRSRKIISKLNFWALRKMEVTTRMQLLVLSMSLFRKNPSSTSLLLAKITMIKAKKLIWSILWHKRETNLLMINRFKIWSLSLKSRNNHKKMAVKKVKMRKWTMNLTLIWMMMRNRLKTLMMRTWREFKAKFTRLVMRMRILMLIWRVTTTHKTLIKMTKSMMRAVKTKMSIWIVIQTMKTPLPIKK